MKNKKQENCKTGINQKLTIPTILMSIEEAITTIAIQRLTVTTTMAMPTVTIRSVSYSNTISDGIFYGIYPVKVLVLKRFIPSKVI